MISDNQTNFLYLADLLPVKYSVFYNSLEEILVSRDIPFGLLPGTKDIWARDYMPVQIDDQMFLQFTYNPGYLSRYKKYLPTISDPKMICTKININARHSTILLDGGNIVKGLDCAIITDRVFSENPGIGQKELIGQLEALLEVSKIIIIPADAHDFTGHADGMVRFLNKTTVLMNDYSREKKPFSDNLRNALQEAGLAYIEIPYNPYCNKSLKEANGTYINFLQLQDVIILPAYSIQEDDTAFRIFEELFSNDFIVSVKSRDIANEGGVLNCISWTIKK